VVFMKPPDLYLIRFMISAGQTIHVMVAKHIEDILIRIKGGDMKTDCGHDLYWHGCYSGSSDLITPESVAHPAKMSATLCFRILEHLKELGLLEDNDTILDPMGGTGITAICAGAKGYRAVTVELEEKFIDFCQTYLCPGVVHYSVEEKILLAVKAGEVTVATDGVGEDGELKYRTYYQKAQPERKRYKVHATSRCGKGEWHPVHRVIGNKDYAERKLYKKLDWTILKGDARKLSELLSERGLVTCMSPPYQDAIYERTDTPERMAERLKQQGQPEKARQILKMKGTASCLDWKDGYGTTPGQIGNMRDVPLVSITSPPYEGQTASMGKLKSGSIPHDSSGNLYLQSYGTTPGQIGNLPDRPLKTVMSPPYNNTRNTTEEYDDKYDLRRPPGVKWGRESFRGRYGESEGQIGALPDKPLITLTSPPYEDSSDNHPDRAFHLMRRSIGKNNIYLQDRPYGQSEGQIGQEKSASYLSEMLKVYQEIGKVSSVLAIVVKNPTRNGKLRRLDLDTIKILELAGWRIHCRHRALLFEELEQADLFGGTTKKVKGRMSFFKRLGWIKGQPTAQWEDVLIAVI